MKRIQFYKPTDPFGEFSNFSKHPVVIDEKEWPTTEHYFQAQKFSGTIYEEEIRKLKTPMEAKISGADRNKPLRKDWEKIKDDISLQSSKILPPRIITFELVVKYSSRPMNVGFPTMPFRSSCQHLLS